MLTQVSMWTFLGPKMFETCTCTLIGKTTHFNVLLCCRLRYIKKYFAEISSKFQMEIDHVGSIYQHDVGKNDGI